MNIENSDQVTRLCREARELEKAITLLSGGGYLRVHGNDPSCFTMISDQDTKQKVIDLVKERMERIKEQLKPL